MKELVTKIRNTSPYENLNQLLGKEFAGLIYKLVDHSYHSDDKFVQGFVAACSITMQNHGEDTIVRDTYQCNFKTVEELKLCGVDQFDIDTLTPIINEIIKRNQNATS